jgi:hypothetical protein
MAIVPCVPFGVYCCMGLLEYPALFLIGALRRLLGDRCLECRRPCTRNGNTPTKQRLFSFCVGGPRSIHYIFPPATLCKVLGWGSQVPGPLASSKWSQVRLQQINNNAIPGPRSAWSQVPGQVRPAASGRATSSGSATADAWWPGASAGHAARLP